MVEVVLRSHVWLFIVCMQEIRCEVTRKVCVAGLHHDPEPLKRRDRRSSAFAEAMAGRQHTRRTALGGRALHFTQRLASGPDQFPIEL